VSRYSVHGRQVVVTSGTDKCLQQVRVTPGEINENTTGEREGEGRELGRGGERDRQTGSMCVHVFFCMDTAVFLSLPAMPLPSAVSVMSVTFTVQLQYCCG
jgi:hypothetical protein